MCFALRGAVRPLEHAVWLPQNCSVSPLLPSIKSSLWPKPFASDAELCWEDQSVHIASNRCTNNRSSSSPADTQVSHDSSSQGIHLSGGISALVVNAPTGITFWASFQGLILHDNNLMFSCRVPFKYVTLAVIFNMRLSFAFKSNCGEWHLY